MYLESLLLSEISAHLMGSQEKLFVKGSTCRVHSARGVTRLILLSI